MKQCPRRILAAVCSAAMILSVNMTAAAATAQERPGARITLYTSISEGGLGDLLKKLRDECSRPPVCDEPGTPDLPIAPDPPPDTPDPPPDTPHAPPDTPDYPPQDGDAGTELSAYVRQVVQLVNERRAEADLGALSVSDGAAKAAKTRAEELETRFSHTRPDGARCFTALADADVIYSYAGENIAYGQQTPEQVMTAWMNSSGHRANILNADFTQIGVGVYTGADGTIYWTQMFIG